MNIIDEIKEELKHNSTDGTARKFGVSRKTVYKIREGLPVLESQIGKGQLSKINNHLNKDIGMSITEFNEKHDPEIKIKKQLEKAVSLLRERKIYKDCDIRREVGCNDAWLWKEHISNEEGDYFKYVFVIGKEIFWSLPELVDDILSTNPRTGRLI